MSPKSSMASLENGAARAITAGPKVLHRSATSCGPPAGHGLVAISGVSWQTYQALRHDVGERHIRLTYDHGTLEIMTPLFRHESYSGVLGLLVKALAAAAKVRVKSAWSTTLEREDLERGLEPDRCFYIRNADAILGKLEIDLRRDPPPDLAIEVDVMSSSLNRLGVYAALGVPELWHFDGQRFEVLVRRDKSGYDSVAHSPCFPALAIAEVAELLHEVVGLDDEAQERRVRAWVKQHKLPRKTRGKRRKPK